jgi:hypothetical protein
VDESIRRSCHLVQAVAAALLHMHPAERRLLIRPLIALIERVVDSDTGSISAVNRAIAARSASNGAL